MDGKEKILRIMQILAEEYPDAKTSLRYQTPLQLLIATVLSAQSTDETVNKVTKKLFPKYRKAEDYAAANLEALEKDIRATGFYHVKAKYLKGIGQILVEKFGSRVPETMDELTMLPGVARKTANIVLSNAFGVVEGIAVDTHVRRLALRLGLTQKRDQNKIETDLMQLLPKNLWSKLTDLLISHGRRICKARKPACQDCGVSNLCPSAFSF